MLTKMKNKITINYGGSSIDLEPFELLRLRDAVQSQIERCGQGCSECDIEREIVEKLNSLQVSWD